MEYLNIAFISADQYSVINDLIQLTAKHHCHVEESRITVLGSDFAGILRVGGNWNAIAKIEAALTKLKNKATFLLEVKRCDPWKLTGDHLPYLAQVVGLNTPGLIPAIARFYSDQQIQLIDLQTDPFKTSHSETTMITLSMRINIPAEINIADLRERFMILCDELNIDGIIEPEKR